MHQSFVLLSTYQINGGGGVRITWGIEKFGEDAKKLKIAVSLIKHVSFYIHSTRNSKLSAPPPITILQFLMT